MTWFDPEWPAPLDEQLNPDVSIRTSGIMEKCTFCVQRIRRARDVAKDEEREIRDGDVQPACGQACPAQAIVFGDLSDPNSRVSRLASSRRGFHLLEELGTRPRVVYLKEAGE
jgi:molybdopterin-containing oxidoreductase family iron-sulfur binding subunit